MSILSKLVSDMNRYNDNLGTWYDPWFDDYPCRKGTWWPTSITTTVVHFPVAVEDKETGEVTESVSFDVPGLSAKDIKVSWDKDTRTLTLTGNNEKLGRTYTFSINTFSEDLLEDTLETTVENGVATVSGKLKTKKKKEEENSKKVLDVAVKDGTAKP